MVLSRKDERILKERWFTALKFGLALLVDSLFSRHLHSAFLISGKNNLLVNIASALLNDISSWIIVQFELL